MDKQAYNTKVKADQACALSKLKARSDTVPPVTIEPCPSPRDKEENDE